MSEDYDLPRSPTWIRSVLSAVGGFAFALVAAGAWVGIALALLPAIIAVGEGGGGDNAVVVGLGSGMLMSGMFIGLTQLVWIVPLAIGAFLLKPVRMAAAGLLIGAALVFLLNAACFGLTIGLTSA